MRFLGNVDCKTDVKGRVFLPAVFRKVLQASGDETMMLRKDIFQPCLVLYPESVWNEMEDTLRRRLNKFNAQHQQIFRQFVEGAEMVTLDGNGRLLIPKRYMDMAFIRQDVRFIGMDDTIEIWSCDKIEQTRLSNEDFSKALEAILGQETTPADIY